MSAGADELDLELAELPPVPPPPALKARRRARGSFTCYLRPCPLGGAPTPALEPDQAWTAHYLEAHYEGPTPAASHR